MVPLISTTTHWTVLLLIGKKNAVFAPISFLPQKQKRDQWTLASCPFAHWNTQCAPSQSDSMRLHGLRTVAKWFNCNAIRCTDCAFCKRATNWFAHFITCSVLACYSMLHCTLQSILLQIPSGFTCTAIWWLISPLPKNFSVSLQNDHWPSQKKDCPTFAALYMRVI